MTNNSAEARAAPAGGILLLLLACLPYVVLVAMLPDGSDFPGEGGGEARMAWGFQQFWAYLSWGLTLALLWLALWRASRSGGIARWARQTMPLLIPAAGVAMLLAIAQGFEQPGPWLPLVPTLLPPAIGVYVLWACCPVLSRRLSRAKIDVVAIGVIATLSLAVIPLWVLDAASYPGRLARHHAELAAADAAARLAGEQEEQRLRADFARLGPDSSLRNYIEGRYWYLSGVDVIAGARRVRSRQSDAIVMLDEGLILDLADLWQLDLEPTKALCAAYAKALAAAFGPSSRRGEGSAYLSLLERQFRDMQWLREGHCHLDGAIEVIDGRLRWMLESKDPTGAVANDPAAYYSRWGVGRETVEAMRVKLAGFRGGP